MSLTLRALCSLSDLSSPLADDLRALFLRSLSNAYADLTEEALGLAVSKHIFLQETFDAEVERLVDENVYWLLAQEGDRHLGVAMVEGRDAHVHLRQLFVDTTAGRRGVGSALVKRLSEANTERVTADARRLNFGGIAFYEKLGFLQKGVPEDEGLDGEMYVSFELFRSKAGKGEKDY